MSSSFYKSSMHLYPDIGQSKIEPVNLAAWMMRYTKPDTLDDSISITRGNGYAKAFNPDALRLRGTRPRFHCIDALDRWHEHNDGITLPHAGYGYNWIKSMHSHLAGDYITHIATGSKTSFDPINYEFYATGYYKNTWLTYQLRELGFITPEPTETQHKIFYDVFGHQMAEPPSIRDPLGELLFEMFNPYHKFFRGDGALNAQLRYEQSITGYNRQKKGR